MAHGKIRFTASPTMVAEFHVFDEDLTGRTCLAYDCGQPSLCHHQWTCESSNTRCLKQALVRDAE